jgi:fido (protein-threonine AMPylation protein)
MSQYKEYTGCKEPVYRQYYWDIAAGLQDVDGLKPSRYLYELAEKHIDGQLSNDEIEQLLYKKYENETEEEIAKRQREADIVCNRIVKLLEDESFIFSPVTLKYIHGELFKDIYPEWAGRYRDVNIFKEEPILGGNTVRYANYQMIEDTFAYDFAEEKKIKYAAMSQDEIIKHISEFTSSIWQVHAFREGNTRTTAVFIEKYLISLGFEVNNIPFKENSKYFRNALVRSNYADYSKRIDTDYTFLYRFFENLMFGGENKLLSRDTIILSLIKENKGIIL